MKPPPFVYHDPTTVDEAADLLGRLDNAPCHSRAVSR